MPQNTFRVKLTPTISPPRVLNYYIPLLVYKTTNIKLGEQATVKHKVLHLNYRNYQDKLAKLTKSNGNDDDFQKEQEYLTKALQQFFSFGDNGVQSAPLLIYKDDPSTVRTQIHEGFYTFIVLINTFNKEDGFKGGDGLSIYKDDFSRFDEPELFYVFATKETEIKELFKEAGKNKDRRIVVYSYGDEAQVHLKFVSKYLSEASFDHAVGAYGINLGSVYIIRDEETLTKLRKANINFYSLLNETGFDGRARFKEGIDLAGNDIDEFFTYFYIKNECIKTLIQVWEDNGRRNSKLSAFQLEGKAPTPYSSALQTLFCYFQKAGLIAHFSNIKLELDTTPNIIVRMEVSIVYNKQIKDIQLVILARDIDYYKRSIGV